MRAQGVFGASRRLSGLSVSLCMAMAFATVVASPAEARRRHHRAPAAAPANYAAFVVDANSGRTLYARNEDAIRHPASVTKVMTLYMLFEQLEKGRYRLDSPLRVSAHGASMAPSKLGLRPGQTIEVEDAIKALVTKSANDVAATIAENIGGDEDAFAEMMTRKARSLGMRNTVYRNASGLPNPQQVTTARDLAILGRAVQERFPRYYHYFGTPSFRYGGRTIGNHNRLLGRVEGVDGIKTGYTRASGFNLLTSAKRDGRHIVGVVLGGRTGRERDMIMAQLVNTQIAHASPVRSSTQLASLKDDDDAPAAPQRVAMAEPVEAPRVATKLADDPIEPSRRRLAPLALASTSQTPMAAAAVAAAQAIKARPAVISDDEDEGVTTASVRPPQKVIGARPAVIAAASTPSVLPPMRRGAERRVAMVAPPSREALNDIPGKRAKAAVNDDGDDDKVVAKPDAKSARQAKADRSEKADKSEQTQRTAKAEKTGKVEKVARKDAEERTEVARSRQAAARDGVRPSGWSIQIGATDNVEKANALLAKARGAGHLASAKSYTEKVQKGSSTLYRARFAGLETDQAQSACKQLKRSGFACFATKD